MRKTKNPFHPGQILLEEFLAPMGVTQSAFADKVGWSKHKLNAFIRGKRNLTAHLALDLAHVLNTSPRVWINLQNTWCLNKAIKARSSKAG